MTSREYWPTSEMDLSEVLCLCSGRILELFIYKELHQEKVYRLPHGKERS